MAQVHGFESWSDEELRVRMLSGEGRAWREFHARFDRLVQRCIQRVTARFARSLSSDDAREIHAQFLIALTTRDMHRLRAFDPTRGNKLSSWIAILATNCAWDHLRTLSRMPARADFEEAIAVDADDGDPFDHVLQHERWRCVQEALATFSEKDQTFVRLYYMDGLSPEQVAAEMAISVKTVYTKKHKIGARLEQALQPLVREAA